MKLPFLLTALVLSFQATAASQGKWYEIEMLVFSRQPEPALKEQFEAPEQLLSEKKALDLIQPLYQPTIAELLQRHAPCQTPAPTESLPTDSSTAPLALEQIKPLTVVELDGIRQLLAQSVKAPVSDELPSTVAPNQDTNPSATGEIAAADPSVALEDTEVAQNSVEAFNPQTCQMEQWTADGQLLSRPLTAAELALQFPLPEHIPALISGSGEAKDSAYLLSADQFSLTALANKLRQDSSKQMLLHTAWRQPLVSSKRSSHWYAGDYTAEAEETVAGTEPELIQQVQQQLNALASGQSSLQSWFSPWQLEGVVSLRAGRFILFDGSFYLRQANGALPAQIVVQQQARLVLGQLNYLDHPRLGIIIQVKRFDPAGSDPSVNPK